LNALQFEQQSFPLRSVQRFSPRGRNRMEKCVQITTARLETGKITGATVAVCVCCGVINPAGIAQMMR
jgi:hypothetical protein